MTEMDRLSDWLRLEAADASEERVDEALTALFRSLPVFDPGPAFTRRVLRRARWAPQAAHWFGLPVVRAVVALCVVQGALLMGLLPAVVAAATSSLGVPGAVSALVSTAVVGFRWLAEAASLGATVTRALASFAGHPSLVALVALCLVVSATGLVALIRVRSSVLRSGLHGGAG